MKIAIVGGGIGGLGLALALHARGLGCDVYESVPEVREIGVGIRVAAIGRNRRCIFPPRIVEPSGAHEQAAKVDACRGVVRFQLHRTGVAG